MLDKKKATSDILNLDSTFSWYDSYRNTTMIPLCTKNGDAYKKGTSNSRQGEFMWTHYCPMVIQEYFDNLIFPWINMRSRVMALITMPNQKNHIHIDCNKNELNTQQHKFRIVLQGSTSTLFFLTQAGNLHVPDIEDAFVMDGSWVHGMTNTDKTPKVTLALGSPWTGNKQYNNLSLLLKKSDYLMPDDLDKYWQQ